MKHTKKVSAAVGAAVLLSVLLFGVLLHCMEPFKFTPKSRRRGVPVESYSVIQEQSRYKSDIVWVKTSDGMLLEVPQWQIDQSKVLQVMLVHQKGSNSTDTPINASMITSKQLALLQEALRKASNLKIFKEFYISLSGPQQKALLADAFTLEMQGLASLLITYMFPVEVQQQMGATTLQQAGIIAPVIAYLQNPEKIALPHKGAVKQVALSPDGNRIISASGGIDHNLILYDFKNRKVIKNLVSETFPEPCVAFSPDGNYVVAGSIREFDTLILFDAITGEKIKIFGEGNPVNCVTFSADGNSILAGSEFKYRGYKPILYDVKTGKIISAYKEKSFFSERLKDSFEDYYSSMGSMVSAAYKPYSNDIVIGADVASSISHNLVLYDYKTYKRIRSFVGLSQGTPCIAFSADGKYLAGGTLELILWGAETGKKIQSFENRWGRILSVALHPSGDYVVVGFMNNRGPVILFNCETGKSIKRFDGISDVRCVAFSPDGYSLICGGKEGVMLFKLTNKKTLDAIATQLNLAQARLLYRLYLAKINNTPVILDIKDLDYQIFTTLPANVQQVVRAHLPFELFGDIAKNELQQKIQELRSSLFYHTSLIWGPYEKKHDEKIKAVKDEMQKFEKNSVAYQACEQLLIELETEEAFK